MRASPGGQPPTARHSANSAGPAARWMAPSTPPPPSRLEFAALTIASAATSVVMSPRCRLMLAASGARDVRVGKVSSLAAAASGAGGWLGQHALEQRAGGSTLELGPEIGPGGEQREAWNAHQVGIA